MIQVIFEIMCWFWIMRWISMFTPMYYYVTLRSVLSENKQEIKSFLTTSCTDDLQEKIKGVSVA